MLDNFGNPKDELEREIKVGDIIMYATARSSTIWMKHAVVESFKQPGDLKSKISLSWFKIKREGYWDTPDGSYHYGANFTYTGDSLIPKKSTKDSSNSCIVITDLELPDTEEFKALRARSMELLNGKN